MKNLREVALKSMKNKSIRYFISKNEEGKDIKYGITILEICSGKKYEEKIENISNSESFVLNLIDFLYDNAIDTAHFKDIVEDFTLIN